MKSKSLQDLDAMRKKIADNAKIKELAEQARIAAEKRAEAERNLFTRAGGKVAPIANQERVWSPPQRPTPRPLQQDLDDEAVMHESMSDEFDISTLLDAPALVPMSHANYAKANGVSKGRLIYMVCVATKRAMPWGNLSAMPNVWVGAVCAWCTAKVWALRVKSLF